ncbi:MAG: GUN4 domain-containing protein [Nostoc sp.]|uniref:GUN4 domain-containing protein n=1 Tax=Nostoc sp. TaxID=1180 RepID=UPI002FFB4F1D
MNSVENFPCTDLRTIDQLWVKYSNGRFGFSVQKRIWESVGKDYGKFGDRVGWRKWRTVVVDKWFGLRQQTEKQSEWLNDSDLLFNTSAPEGHLPTAPHQQLKGVGLVGFWGFGGGVFFSRIETCKL